MPFIFLFIAICSNIAAQILFKLAAIRGLYLELQFPDIVTKNFVAILAVFCIIFAAPFYFFALKSISLSVAYPVLVVVTFLFVNLLAVNYLGEKLNMSQLFGYVLAVLGIFLIVYFAERG